MIIKSFLIEKNISIVNDYYAVIFYGENIGLKDDLKNLIKNSYKSYDLLSFYQDDILKNPKILNEQILNNSLFSKKKVIIVNETSEKLRSYILDALKQFQEDVKIFFFAENLDKKSNLRSYFEKEKKLAIVPCYQDNEKTLSFYLRNKFKDYKGLNQELINRLIKNSGLDRNFLTQEIEKIKSLSLSKEINEEKIMKLINNEYNIDFDNLRDSCLEANKIDLNKNLGNILIQNEKAYFYINNLTNRIQKLLDLNKLLNENNNVDLAIEEVKPKIFWKDKPIFKKQLKFWNLYKLEKAKKIIFETEIIIKTKLNSLSNILIKKLLIDLCNLADTNA